MFPATFTKNLRNYNEFQKYFGWVFGSQASLGRYSMEQKSGLSIGSFFGNIVDGVKV